MEPIFLADHLAIIDQKLIELLNGLNMEDWVKQSIAPRWTIKDIAVHLLDGNIRTLSMLRDNYYGENPENIYSYEALVKYLNELNADWVKAMKRVSPKIIVELLESTGKQYCEYINSLDPFEKSAFSVAWAGEEESLNWFHIAREYTEKWTHQQQIRLALGKENDLLEDKFHLPYLDTSMRALPFHYRNIDGKDGDLIKFSIHGISEKNWYLSWNGKQWILSNVNTDEANCEVKIKDEIAWKIFSKGIDKTTAIGQSEIIGEKRLGINIFELVAVMA